MWPWPQDPEGVDPRFGWVGLAVVAVTFVLCGAAAGLQSAWRSGIPPVQLPVHREGVPPADLFDEATAEHTVLPDQIQWVDRSRGIVAIPIDDAIDLVLREEP